MLLVIYADEVLLACVSLLMMPLVIYIDEVL